MFLRADLAAGHRLTGPAIVIEPNQTIVVEDGWAAALTPKDHLVLERVTALPQRVAVGTRADPVMLEIFNNRFMSIAEQMGVTLQNTAYSVNIKERLDFSCAVFDAQGTLVANAPHMPVHLGSMDKSVETVIRNNSAIRPGDVFALNAPYNGGTHLPDITVCTPVFDDDEAAILFWVASRGHHADVGGVAPGSMSPLATHIEEEGVYIDNFKIVDRGRFREEETRDLLTGARYPARNPLQNLNDLKAQIAANEKGVAELKSMIGYFGLDVVEAYMGHVQDNAAESVRRVLDRSPIHPSTTKWTRAAASACEITVDKARREATVDFTGTSEQRADNFNAPAPVTRAAVLYVFRVMVEDEIPMNAGCLRPIRIIVPDGSMLSPRYPAAVVAGNVEVSQAVTNCLFGALGAMAASQGTMNNLTFGNDVLSVLRDDLLRLAGRTGLRRHRRRPHAHDQFAPHRSGDPRDALPGRAGGFPHPAALGRAGTVAGRRRHQPHDPLPRAHGLRHPVLASPRAAVRPRRRRARRGRPHPRAARGRARRGAEGLRPDRARGRRGRHRDHADGRRLRPGVMP